MEMDLTVAKNNLKQVYHFIDAILSKRDYPLVQLLLHFFESLHLRSSVINFYDPKLARALIYTTLAPIIWNILARLEYFFHIISFLFFGKRMGCYVLALWILLFSLYRDLLVMEAIQVQPTLKYLEETHLVALAYILGALGGILVITSFLRLGITGTFLGDYFGIYLEEKVSGFPFSFCSNPMYDGSTLLFISKALLASSPAGLLLAFWVYVMYRIACTFEEPFTDYIYRYRATNQAKKKR
ncbi:hypothetical protein GpartN1_g293.t1 [Galdieria partita]|uniref:Phosphatidylethanolamine N-methyltransferase n=1 Tax=Galdieria partita TaxID=83374 RepID=A0A9C7PRP0_9RHOD|nr:hypothetical protein GpartN1_g293.t1 [Galdieria partita]